MFDFDYRNAMHVIAISLVPALLGIILHEVAHGWVAKKCGDPTAERMGRLTLNPLPHIDPLGLAMFGLTSLSGAFVFGWAKPVPVDPRYFRNPAKGMMLVSLAGPGTNFLLAIAFGIALRACAGWLDSYNEAPGSAMLFVLQSLQAGVVINFGLGWLNLVPVPPLDGSKVVAYFMPPNLAMRYLALARYGFIILLVLLVTGLLGKILSPLIFWSSMSLLRILGF